MGITHLVVITRVIPYHSDSSLPDGCQGHFVGSFQGLNSILHCHCYLPLERTHVMQERAGSLDGGAKIQGLQLAMGRLRTEMRQMDLRIGVLQQQLLGKQRGTMARMHQHLPDSDDSDG